MFIDNSNILASQGAQRVKKPPEMQVMQEIWV